MSRSNSSTLRYQRCRFRTALPTDRQYTSSHYWLAREEAGVWRVGLTKWGTRMLGEIVEWQLDLLPGAPLTLAYDPAQITAYPAP